MNRLYKQRAWQATRSQRVKRADRAPAYPDRSHKFDKVAQMSVEGVSIPSVSRIKQISWNTVSRWQQKAAGHAKQFNKHYIRNYELIELQADEIYTFIGSKKNSQQR